MIIGLLIILLLVLVLPFAIKKVEHNLEVFLFIMGLAATIISSVLGWELIHHILVNTHMYMITAAVLIAGLLFKLLQKRVKGAIEGILTVVPIKLFIFLVVVVLGLASSFITAIIAALVLVEIVNNMPIDRKNKVTLDIIACFAIGLGAALTPVGEPLATIAISKLNADFWYLARNVGIYIVPGVIAFGILGAFMVGGKRSEEKMVSEADGETYQGVVIRSVKILAFIAALELLGAGFKPMIDTYIIQLDSRLLYWINMISAVLDNATLTAAEISDKMTLVQIKAILMGLLISGGMLIPGNIPNIISAGKLNIGSSEWGRLGVPLGLVVMAIYFVILFYIV